MFLLSQHLRMPRRETARCPECEEELTADDIDYMGVTRENSAFVCTECGTIIGFT